MIRKMCLWCILLACAAPIPAQVPHQKPMLGQQIDWSNSISEGLVGYWLMNEGAGGTVYDLSGNGNHGTLEGNTSWKAGKYGSCLDFDGDGDYVSFSEAILLGTPITISVWVNVTSVPLWTTRSLFSISDTDSSNYYIQVAVSRSGGDEIYFKAEFRDTSSGVATSSATSTGAWYHVVGVFPNAISRSIYVDGAVTVDNTVRYGVGSNQDSSAIGGRLDSGGLVGSLDGQIDDVMIFDRALSAAEIRSLYADPYQMFVDDDDYVALWQAALSDAGGSSILPILQQRRQREAQQ